MKPGRIIILLAVLLIAIVLYLNKCRNSNTGPSAATKSKSSNPVSVNGFIVQPERIEEVIHLFGNLLSNKEVDIRNEIPGKLLKIYFKEGSSVKEGDLLVKIYDTDMQAQKRKLEADHEVLLRNQERQKDLLSIEGVSKQEYEEALSAVKRNEADLDLIKSQISKTEIRAPFGGRTGLERVNEGSFLPLNTLIVSLQDLNPMKLDFSLPEKYRLRVKEGQKLKFSIEGSSRIYEAKVYAMEPKIDPQTRSILMRAYADNSDGSLSPGAFARIDLPLEEIDKAMMVPTQALVPELKGYKVFILKNGKANFVSVETGIRNDSTVQIISGLNTGDTLLTNGIMQLKPDMPVNAIF